MKTQEQKARAVQASMRWRKKNVEKARACNRRHYYKFRDRYRKSRRQWLEGNRERHNENVARHHAQPHIRIKYILRRRLSHALKKNHKSASTMDLLGCSINDFMRYLESRFETGMTWENYGLIWHIDHIIPCALFDLTREDHQRTCFHFSNLQPMFAMQNILKGKKVVA